MVTRATKAKKVEDGVFDLSDLGLGNEFVLAEDYTHADVKDWIPTGIPSMDSALTGGLPMGRVIEIYSLNNVGKTTLAIQVNRMANKMGVPVFWFDVEGTNNRSHLEEMGVDMQHTVYYQPDDRDIEATSIENIAQQMVYVMEKLQQSHRSAVFIWDSVGASMTKKTITGDFDDQQPGREAKAFTKALAKLTPLATATNSMIILINQVRDKIGGMGFGDQTDTPGGKALKHYATFRINLKNLGQNKLAGNPMGHKVKLVLTKSKLGEPHVTSESLLFGQYGFNELINILREGVDAKLIKSASGGNKGKYYRFVNPDGEPIDIYEKQIPELIESGELERDYLPYFQDLYLKLIDLEFPKGYPALNNQHFHVQDIPFMAKLGTTLNKPKEKDVDEEKVEEEQ